MNAKLIKILYLSTILIWGTTWYPIKLSSGVVAPEISVIYRLLIASVVLFVWCFHQKLPMRYTLSQHFFIALFGVLLYGVNLTLLYSGSVYLPSGVVAIVFSTIVIMNIINGLIFLGRKPSFRSLFGASIGLIGIAITFKNDLLNFNIESASITGIMLILSATLAASLGNITSIRNQKNNIPVTQCNAFAMLYGAIALSIYAYINNSLFNFDPSATYVISLLYLAFFGSVIAFGFYLKLLSLIGADKAAYANLLFPAVAVLISYLLGEQGLTPYMLMGIAIIVFGNYLILIQRKKI